MTESNGSSTAWFMASVSCGLPAEDRDQLPDPYARLESRLCDYLYMSETFLVTKLQDCILESSYWSVT